MFFDFVFCFFKTLLLHFSDTAWSCGRHDDAGLTQSQPVAAHAVLHYRKNAVSVATASPPLAWPRTPHCRYWKSQLPPVVRKRMTTIRETNFQLKPVGTTKLLHKQKHFWEKFSKRTAKTCQQIYKETKTNILIRHSKYAHKNINNLLVLGWVYRHWPPVSQHWAKTLMGHPLSEFYTQTYDIWYDMPSHKTLLIRSRICAFIY